MKNSLLNSKLTHKQHVLTLDTVSKKSDVAPLIETFGLSKTSLSIEIGIYHDNNRREIFWCVLETNHAKVRTIDD